MAKSHSIRLLSDFSDEASVPRNFYLWGYQPHFAIAMKVAAESLFGELDSSLTPGTFVVAVNTDGSSTHPGVVVEPDDHDFRPEIFGKVMQLARELENAAPGPSYGYPAGSKEGEAWAKQEQRRDSLAVLRRALLQTVEGNSQCDPPKVYVSPGREVHPYVIFSVLLIPKRQYESHPLLHRTTRKDALVVPSLIDAVAREFVEACCEALLSSLAGNSWQIFPPSDVLLRAAGATFMYTPFAACDTLEGLHGGFDTCNAISALTYEKGVGYGRLVFARNGHENVKQTIAFRDPPKLRNFRAVRKLLQLAHTNDALISDSYRVRGIGTVTDDYNSADEDLFSVEFLGHAKWRLIHNNTTLMRVEYGIPRLPHKRAQIRRFTETFARLFPAAREHSSTIGRIAAAVTELDHGTILIITENAAEESDRFGDQCMRIDPQPLTNGLLAQASRIDGAIVVSPEGICHAIGVILDGRANDRGTAERGARFNSTVRYVHGSECPCVGLVVSDDGMIDVVPEYRAVMSRSEIERRIQHLRYVVGEPDASRRKVCNAIDWITNHAFYYTQSQCDEINRLLQEDAARPDPGAFRIQYDKLRPHPDMNDSYLRE